MLLDPEIGRIELTTSSMLLLDLILCLDYIHGNWTWTGHTVC